MKPYVRIKYTKELWNFLMKSSYSCDIFRSCYQDYQFIGIDFIEKRFGRFSRETATITSHGMSYLILRGVIS